MPEHDKRKQSLYFPSAMHHEIEQEALRLDRSMSWIMQRVWLIARATIRKEPGVNEIPDPAARGDGPPSTKAR